ncbi:MAG TPA: tetratricopeptide repeat protein [Verrucomicrobiae bacterium]
MSPENGRRVEWAFSPALRILSRARAPFLQAACAAGTGLGRPAESLFIGLTLSLGVFSQEQQLHGAAELSLQRPGATNSEKLVAVGGSGDTKRHPAETNEAILLLQRTVEEMTRGLGPHHTNTLHTVSELAKAPAKAGKAAEGERFAQEALDGLRRELGTEHPETLRAMFNLAEVYARQLKTAELERVLDQLLPMQSRVLGPKHPDTLATVAARATAYLHANRPDKAEPMLKELLEVRRRVQGAESAETTEAMEALATAFIALEEQSKARQLYQDLLAVRRRLLGSDNPKTLRTQHDLCHLCSSMADYTGAALGREELLPRECRVLGPDHHDSRCTLSQLGYDYFQLGRLPEAQKCFADLLELQTRLSGPRGLETDAARDALAECLARRGKAAAAAALYADWVAAERRRDDARRQDSPPGLFAGALEDRLAAEKKPALTNNVLVAATVNGRPIFETQVQQALAAGEDRLRRQFASQPEVLRRRLEELRKETLENLISQELITRDFFHERFEVPGQSVEEAVARQINSQHQGDTNQFLRLLAATGRTLDDIRLGHERRLIEQAMRHRKLLHLAAPTPGEIELYYFTHEAEFRLAESVDLGLIAVNKNPTNTAEALTVQQKEVRDLRARLAAGADFAAEARLHSQGAQARNGGNWGWIEVSALRKELAEVAKTLKLGEVSEVIETPEAFYIMHIKDRRPASLQPLPVVRERIEKDLIRTRREAAEERWIESLRRSAVIAYY